MVWLCQVFLDAAVAVIFVLPLSLPAELKRVEGLPATTRLIIVGLHFAIRSVNLQSFMRSSHHRVTLPTGKPQCVPPLPLSPSSA